MTHRRLASIAIAAVLFIGTTPALAGHIGATPVDGKTLQLERLGPKFLLGPRSRIRPTTSTKRILPLTARTLLVEEFGPKYLLGYEHLRTTPSGG
jgi:hypothetical protein